MKIKIALASLFIAISMPSMANLITVDQARQVAEKQISAISTVNTKGTISTSSISEPITVSRNGEAVLYVFNHPQGGFVIVSADDETERQVLGWSDKGCYDSENIPVQLADIIESYASGIGRMRVSLPRDNGSVSRTENSLPDSVSPLLKDIAWGQMQPYNAMCPSYVSGGDTYNYPTGCVATAIAQIMKYHGYPAKGKGSNSYEWNDTILSADFSKSTYLWDKMLPNYNDGRQYTQEQVDAVALLIHDLGIALDMDYAVGGSGTALSGYELVNYFDYGKGLKAIMGDYSSTQEWEGVLRNELAAGYPVLCEGGSTAGGHEFLCDGYNAEGLFHYNFGWDGIGNGWFASTATGFDASPGIIYGIRPVSGGEAALSLSSQNDFKWVENNTLEGWLAFRYVSLERYSDVKSELGLALKDTVSGSVTYYTVCTVPHNNMAISDFDFNSSVPDGAYKVYPVARPVGKEQWQTFFHNDLYQLEIDLTVADGVKTWQNKGIKDPIDEGVAFIDGIYYKLDDNTMEAEVARRNSKNPSYSGYVVVPETVTYQGKSYNVTSIGERAFENCTGLDSVMVGSKVITIEMGAFGSSSMKAIRFAKGGELDSISGWAFNACRQLEEVILPDGLLFLGMCTFQSCRSLKNVEIPSSVNGVAPSCFNACTSLESIHVKWTSLDDVYWADDFNADGLTPGFKLYVPKGYSSIYNVAPWTFCTIIEEGEPQPVKKKYVYVLGCDGNWNPAAASDSIAQRSNKCYGGDITVADGGDGYGYFCLGTVLSNSPDDWTTFNANRLGAPSSDFLLISGTTCFYIKGADASFKAQAGTHHLVIDMNAGTIAFDCPDGLQTANAEQSDEQMYDLYGKPVQEPVSGQIIIIDGHKYLIK